MSREWTEVEKSFASKVNYDPSRDGRLVVRFAPEPSGYLHIGHVKAAMLNAFFAEYFDGIMLLRFDDTNPSKEKMEFEKSICEDLSLLNVKFEGPTYTSDYIDRLETSMKDLIRKGLAYCDDTPLEEMRHNRMNGIESPSRSAKTVEDNLADFEEILKGTEKGQTMCVRAKINMQDNNKALRDPVMWRCNVGVPHHRHGTKYKSYPTYDFACPNVDSWSGVTLALRANEYADRIPLYQWVQTSMELRPVNIYEFSRLNLTNTVLSKRKLAWLVDTGIVEGWDDPRFPTVRGMLRRGLVPEALMKFIIELGPSKNTNLMSWDKIWSLNNRLHDQVAPRYMAVDAINHVIINLTGSDNLPINLNKPKHPKHPEMGEVNFELTDTIIIEQEDAQEFMKDELVTLMRAGNVKITGVCSDKMGVDKIGVDKIGVDNEKMSVCTHMSAEMAFETSVKDTKKKVHWISDIPDNYKFVLREYDHIINKRQPEEGDEMSDIVNRESVKDTILIGEPSIKFVKEGEVIQLERRGYVRCDRIRPDDNLRIFVLIPSGKTKNMSVIQTKVDAEKIAKGCDAPSDSPKGLSKKALKKMAWMKAQEAAGNNASPSNEEVASKKTDE
ncbi:glutamyl-tRNA synthetase [Gregarina niphandrodes]|uniref:glutamate--tRNA ligase n=1 Tax=Gregarina niphandrodes TaxID=110365 RepID=A0A023B965_GRENI|nr:glutamyl-tRNA synthetase [Gregarina niphandrodes]EZG71257.1 glutamyl-tRNA synthetase [Gregarina niphandrodes]|eukprot:XP_011129840.1 glutamyl-tRNA synthetase [Gregarina niphandrodes]